MRIGSGRIVAIAGILMASLCAASGAAESAGVFDDVSITLNTAVQSKYVWRGMEIVDEPVFQPCLTVGHGGLSASVWGNMDLTDTNGEQGHFTEIDLSLAYGWEWKRFNFTAGVINYQFPNPVAATTTELFGSVGLDVLLSPTLAVYNDVDETGGGVYSTLGIGHVFENVLPLGDKAGVSLDASACVGWGSSEYNDFYFGVGRSAFTDALFSIGAPVAIGDHLTIRPSVNYSTLLDGRIRGSTDNDDNFWAGISAVYEF